jgi:hypothetical protein
LILVFHICFVFCYRHFAKVYFGLDKTIIATAHGSTAFEAKSKAADRALIILSNRTMQTEVNIFDCHILEASFYLVFTNE